MCGTFCCYDQSTTAHSRLLKSRLSNTNIYVNFHNRIFIHHKTTTNICSEEMLANLGRVQEQEFRFAVQSVKQIKDISAIIFGVLL
jgi:hypothetical protein